VWGTGAGARHLESLGAARVASVFLGADEELYRHRWAPTYPFTAVHFASGIAGDESADVVRAAGALTEVPTRVIVRGELPDDDLGIAVAHAGMALGSFRDSRAIPPVVFDALASGVPVVTADTAAARELLVDGESALLVRPNDPAAAGAAITRLGSDEGLRRQIAESGAAVFAARASRAVLGARWRELLAPLV